MVAYCGIAICAGCLGHPFNVVFGVIVPTLLELIAIFCAFRAVKEFRRLHIVRLALVLSVVALLMIEVIYPLCVFLICAIDNRNASDSWRWVYDRGEFYNMDSSRGLDSSYDGRITLWPPTFLWHQ
jgi:hypothetical protein